MNRRLIHNADIVTGTGDRFAGYGVIRLKWNSFFKKYPDYSRK